MVCCMSLGLPRWTRPLQAVLPQAALRGRRPRARAPGEPLTGSRSWVELLAASMATQVPFHPLGAGTAGVFIVSLY